MGALARLRAATADLHQSLHNARAFARIARGQMDLGSYGFLLHTLYRYHTAMSPFCRAGCVAMDIEALLPLIEWRTQRLRDDLIYLGREIEPAAPAALGGVEEGFPAGCLYTVLGSTLGGKVIYRQLDPLLPTVLGREFFAGAPDDGVMWRDFCARLELYGAPREPMGGGLAEEMVAGAVFAFERFRSYLGE